MQRQNKTQRRKGVAPTPTTDVIGVFGGDTVVKATEDSLDALFAAEAERTFQQTWQSLDRGSRLDRLRRFVQTYPELTPAERASLLTAVLQAFELRQLNSKLAVDYNSATASINAIKGLRERRNAAGLRIFRIEHSGGGSGGSRTTQRAPKKSAAQETSDGAAGAGAGAGEGK